MDTSVLPTSLRHLGDGLRSGRPVAVTPAHRLIDLDLGYIVQDQVWHAGGETVAGYKIGLTSVTAQAAMRCPTPIFGRLAPSAIRSSPASVSVRPDHIRIVEPEIVFEIGSDITPAAGPLDTAALFAAVRSVRAGIEICDTRFDAAADTSAAEIVADNGCADLLIVGAELGVDTLADLAASDVRLTVDGLEVARGTGTNVLGNPIAALAALVRHLHARGETLHAGRFVASGSFAGMTEVPFGAEIKATFSGDVTVAVRLTTNRTGEDRI